MSPKRLESLGGRWTTEPLDAKEEEEAIKRFMKKEEKKRRLIQELHDSFNLALEIGLSNLSTDAILAAFADHGAEICGQAFAAGKRLGSGVRLWVPERAAGRSGSAGSSNDPAPSAGPEPVPAPSSSAASDLQDLSFEEGIEKFCSKGITIVKKPYDKGWRAQSASSSAAGSSEHYAKKKMENDAADLEKQKELLERFAQKKMQEDAADLEDKGLNLNELD